MPKGVYIRTEKTRKSLSDSHKGKLLGNKNPNWKGGKYTTPEGYIMFYSPNHPYRTLSGYVREHRLVVEEHIGRFLLPGEKVHHSNGNPSDNRIENLKFFGSQSDHLREHFLGNNHFGFQKGNKFWRLTKSRPGSFKKGHPFYPRHSDS